MLGPTQQRDCRGGVEPKQRTSDTDADGPVRANPMGEDMKSSQAELWGSKGRSECRGSSADVDESKHIRNLIENGATVFAKSGRNDDNSSRATPDDENNNSGYP